MSSAPQVIHWEDCRWPCGDGGRRGRPCEIAANPEDSIFGIVVCWQHRKVAEKRLGQEIWWDPEVQRIARSALRDLDSAAKEEALAAAEERKRRTSVVYFVERETFIKIGTTQQLAKRLPALGRGGQMPEGMTVGPVHLLATMPGWETKERYLHGRFGDHRIPRTEWFYPAPELLQFVIGLKGYIGGVDRCLVVTAPAP